MAALFWCSYPVTKYMRTKYRQQLFCKDLIPTGFLQVVVIQSRDILLKMTLHQTLKLKLIFMIQL